MADTDMSLIPKTERFLLYHTLGWETKVPRAAWHSQKNQKHQEHAGMLLMTTGVF